MNQERIRERKGTFNGHEHNHAGQHSIQQRLQAARAQFQEWWNGQETGKLDVPYPQNPYLPEGEGTEIELFVDPLTSVREELKSIQDKQ